MEDKTSGTCSSHGADKKFIIFFVEKPEEKRTLRRPRHRWESNNRIVLREIEWEGVDWIHLVQDRDQLWAVMNTVMNLRVP
jgi:hypothetical protein